MSDAGAVSRRALLLGGAGTVVAAAAGGYLAERNNPTLIRLLHGCGDSPAVPPTDYRVVTGSLPSAAMRARLPWVVALPPGHRPGDGTPLVLCLPGRGDDADTLTRIGVPGFATSVGARIAFACPGGGGAYYWHPRADGHDPLRYVLGELMPLVERRFGVGGSPAKRGVMGWSMGGAGALLVAQQQPRVVSVAVGASPAVFPSYAAAVEGHPDTFDSSGDWQRYGVWTDAAALGDVPVRLDCGNADPLAPTTSDLLRRIPNAVGGIGSGCHDPAFWRRVARAELRFLAAHL